MSCRVAVFTSNQVASTPKSYMKKALADRLVAQEQAEFIEAQGHKYAIRLFAVGPVVLRCGQERVYEQAAIEKHPVVFLAGLNRTENRPAILPKFKSARIGHG